MVSSLAISAPESNITCSGLPLTIVSMCTCPRGCPSTLALMALSSLHESCLPFFFFPLFLVDKSSKLVPLWPIKDPVGPLHKKDESFLRASSFWRFPLSLDAASLSHLGNLFQSPSPLLLSPIFLFCPFEDSFLDSM